MALEVVSGADAVHAVLSGGAADTPVSFTDGDAVDALMQSGHAAVGKTWEQRIEFQAAVIEMLKSLATLAMRDTKAIGPADALSLKMFRDQVLMLQHTMGKAGDPTSNPYAMGIVALTPSYAKTADSNLSATIEHLMLMVATLRKLIDDMEGYVITTRNDIQRLREVAAKSMTPEEAKLFDDIAEQIDVSSKNAVADHTKVLAWLLAGAEFLGLTNEKGQLATLVLNDATKTK